MNFFCLVINNAIEICISAFYFVSLRRKNFRIMINKKLDMETYIELQVPITEDEEWFKDLRRKMFENHVNIRWQKGNYHITVVFVNKIIEKLNIHPYAPIFKSLSYKAAPHLTFDKLDVFTSRSGEHIVNLTSSCPSKEFDDFVDNSRKTIAEAGWDYERDFCLHVTLGRISVEQVSLEKLKNIIRQVSIRRPFTLQLVNASFKKRGSCRSLVKRELYSDKESAKAAEKERK